MDMREIRSTTILGVRIGKKIALGGDGQVTMGDMQMKSRAVKVRSFCEGKVLAGFAGAVADAMTLFEKFEGKLVEVDGNLQKAVVEMAKDWRTDKMLKELDALLAIMDSKSSYLLSGSGDVIEPDGAVISIGSGSGYAVSAARAYLDELEYNSEPLPNGSRRLVYVKDKSGWTAPRGSKFLCRYDSDSGFYEPVSKPSYTVFGKLVSSTEANISMHYVQGKNAGSIPTMRVNFDNKLNLSFDSGSNGFFNYDGGKWILISVG